MSVFRNRFLELLDEEDDAIMAGDVSRAGDAQGFADTFENPEDAMATGASHDARNALDPDAINDETIRDVVSKLSDFEDWLQNVEGDCLKKELKAIDTPTSKYTGIVQKTSGEITKAAKELASLKSALTAFYYEPKPEVEQPEVPQAEF